MNTKGSGFSGKILGKVKYHSDTKRLEIIMNTKEEIVPKDYVPFGEEWKAELMKMSKDRLIEFIRRVLIDQKQKQLAELENQEEIWNEVLEDFYGDVLIDEMMQKFTVHRKPK